MPNLWGIYAVGCHLVNIDANALNGLLSLALLDVYTNDLTYLPAIQSDSLQYLFVLARFLGYCCFMIPRYLESNQISSVSSDFSAPNSVYVLFDDNALTSIPPWVRGLQYASQVFVAFLYHVDD